MLVNMSNAPQVEGWECLRDQVSGLEVLGYIAGVPFGVYAIFKGLTDLSFRNLSSREIKFASIKILTGTALLGFALAMLLQSPNQLSSSEMEEVNKIFTDLI